MDWHFPQTACLHISHLEPREKMPNRVFLQRKHSWKAELGSEVA